MSSSENIWISALNGEFLNPTDDVIPLMEEQGRALEEATEGVVRGRFIETQRVPKRRSTSFEGAGASFRELSRLVDSVYGTEEVDALPQRDIGGLYAEKTYGFDIYSDDYKYRPFEVTVGPVYPIKLSVDETIWRESRDEFLVLLPAGSQDDDGRSVPVESGNNLMDFFRVIVRSRKMGFILRRLVKGATSA